MSFQQLNNTECGRSNHLMKLTSHCTQNLEHQQHFDNSFSSGNLPNNAAVPNSFDMNELIMEMERRRNFDVTTTSRSGAELKLDHSVGAVREIDGDDFFQTSIQREQNTGYFGYTGNNSRYLEDNSVFNAENFANFNNGASILQNHYTNASNYRPRFTAPRMAFSLPPSVSNYSPYYPTRPPPALEENGIQDVSGESFLTTQDVLESLESYNKPDVEQDKIQQSENDKIQPLKNDVAKEPTMPKNRQLCWDGHFFPDVNGALNRQSNFSKPEMFKEFFDAYLHVYSKRAFEIKYQKKVTTTDFTNVSSEELLKEKPYPFGKKNSRIHRLDAREKGLKQFEDNDFPKAILNLENALLQNPTDTVLWKKLCYALKRTERTRKALYAARELLKLNPSDLWTNLFMADIYQRNHCSYQACQTLVNWLKNHPLYRDIVPSSFSMPEKTSSIEVDKKTLQTVTSMFITAARRKATDPDMDVQLSLGILFQQSRDYSKVVDCQRTAAEVALRKNGDVLIDLGYSLFLANQPEEALKVFSEASRLKGYNLDANKGVTFVHAYLKDSGSEDLPLIDSVMKEIKSGRKIGEFVNTLAPICFVTDYKLKEQANHPRMLKSIKENLWKPIFIDGIMEYVLRSTDLYQYNNNKLNPIIDFNK